MRRAGHVPALLFPGAWPRLSRARVFRLMPSPSMSSGSASRSARSSGRPCSQRRSSCSSRRSPSACSCRPCGCSLPRERCSSTASRSSAALRRALASRRSGMHLERRLAARCAGACAPARRGSAAPAARSRRCRSSAARRRRGAWYWLWAIARPSSCRRAARASIARSSALQLPVAGDLVEQAQRGGFHARRPGWCRRRSAASARPPTRRADRRRRRGRACRTARLRAARPC